MADHSPHQGGRRPHFHRGRRGSDRRGTDRRLPPAATESAGPDHVDVEQIMRDIRARISQRHGIELSNQQVQELASRRLEAILEPRNVNPSLLEQLRKSAGDTSDVALPSLVPPYAFENTSLYDTHRGLLRVIRRLLNPILKLFFNPTPLVDALHAQTEFNAAVAARETERERRQAEWNALHYEILQRMVTEVARVSLDVQALAARVESLATKVDFNERRVRSMENPQYQNRPAHRPLPATEPPLAAAAMSSGETATTDTPSTEQSSEGPRKRRRRRRGRRSGFGGADLTSAAGGEGVTAAEGDDLDAGDTTDSGEDDASEGSVDEPRVSLEPAHAISPLQPVEPHATAEPVTAPQHDATPADRQEVPRDEPTPSAPADHADPGPPDR